MIEARFNYLAPMDERPGYYTDTPPKGERSRNTRGDRRTLPVHDARDLAPNPSLDREGFVLVHHQTRAADLYDRGEVRRVYFPEMERLVAEATGASRVVAFDHNVRCAEMAAAKQNGAATPVKYAHNDYTVGSGPQRVRDLMGDESEALLRRRFAVINVWKPIRGPVLESPLAVCSADSIDLDDFVATDLRYPDRTGEVYSMHWSPRHRWYYYPRMQADEAMLLKCYDSDPSHARFTAHSAFDHPASPEDAPSRESIEVRTLAFFARDVG
jgi:hypothetical protein